MKAASELLQRGGPVMIAIMVLSVILYSACFYLLLRLRRGPRQALPEQPAARRAALRRRQEQIREDFRLQRISLGAMIAAAPLLGLLGTVNGMTQTFASLADRSSQDSMGNLAHGISEVLVATESGLAVALPAMLVVYLAHRMVQRQVRELNGLSAAGEERKP